MDERLKELLEKPLKIKTRTGEEVMDMFVCIEKAIIDNEFVSSEEIFGRVNNKRFWKILTNIHNLEVFRMALKWVLKMEEI
ncbi:hypothetical protein HOA91_02730 [Candidatus Woesearchaeota archaeon]|jgi:hypothetical protein|nr:hypothetical protein [Candidatus Woesearchaeota archaeon]